MDNFPQILKRLRKELGVTQIIVADNIDMSGRRYNDLETGKSNPSMDTLQKLSKYFDVSVDYLLGNEDKVIENSHFHERLCELRKSKGITQKQVATDLRLVPQSVGNWETGFSTPNLRTFHALCDYFDVSTDWLLCRTENPQSHKS